MFRVVAIVVVVIAAECAATHAESDEFRNWTDESGQFSVEAKIVSVSDGKVVLEKRDGIEVRVPFEKLSRDSLIMAMRFAAGELAMLSKGSEGTLPATDEKKGSNPSTPTRNSIEAIIKKGTDTTISGTTVQRTEQTKKLIDELKKLVGSKVFAVEFVVSDVGQSEGRAIAHGHLLLQDNVSLIGLSPSLPSHTIYLDLKNPQDVTSINIGDRIRLEGKLVVLTDEGNPVFGGPFRRDELRGINIHTFQHTRPSLTLRLTEIRQVVERADGAEESEK